MEKEQIFVGGAEVPVYLNPAYANRHGLIAGATGTGKTVSLQILAEQFSRLGVPVFLSDVKGDLAGLSQSGKPHEKLSERAKKAMAEATEAARHAETAKKKKPSRSNRQSYGEAVT